MSDFCKHGMLDPTCPICYPLPGDTSTVTITPGEEDAVVALLLDAASAQGQCLEEHIWPGHPKYEAIQAVVKAALEWADNDYGSPDTGLLDAVRDYRAALKETK